MRGWLEDLDDGALDDHPAFAVLAGWIWALTGEAARAQRCLFVADGTADAPPPSGSVSITSSIAMLRGALASLGIERMLSDTRYAFEHERPSGPWHTLAGALLGAALLLNGDAKAAGKV